MISHRDPKSGVLTIEGTFGQLTVSENGSVVIMYQNGKVVSATPDTTAETDRDAPSPREMRRNRKRGSK